MGEETLTLQSSSGPVRGRKDGELGSEVEARRPRLTDGSQEWSLACDMEADIVHQIFFFYLFACTQTSLNLSGLMSAYSDG